MILGDAVTRTSPQLIPHQFTSEKARAAAYKSAESKRRKREELAAAPREALALGLMDESAALRQGARLLAKDFASDNATVRARARKDIAVVLNQALGTIETRKPADDTQQQGTLPQDREARMRLLAELEQRLSEDS
jgi:hypothetical protein